MTHGRVNDDVPGCAGGSQTLTVQNGTNANLADLSNATVTPNGGITYVTPPGATLPVIAVQRAQSAQSMSLDPGFDVPALFATYRQLSGEIAGCATTVQLLDGNGNGPWPGSGVATIRLQPGQNVLNVSAAELATLGNLNLTNDSTQLGSATLVINVTDTGDYDWPVPTLGFQGSANAAYILWNLASTGTVTLPATEGDAMWGTVYAPNARLVDLSSADIEGNVVVRELQHGGGAAGGGTADGGEIHNAPFLGTVTPCTSTTTTTTTETTTTTTTTETTTSETTTTTSPVETTTTDSTTSVTTVTTTSPTTGGVGYGPSLPSTGLPATALLTGGAVLACMGCGLLALSRRRLPDSER